MINRCPTYSPLSNVAIKPRTTFLFLRYNMHKCFIIKCVMRVLVDSDVRKVVSDSLTMLLMQNIASFSTMHRKLIAVL